MHRACATRENNYKNQTQVRKVQMSKATSSSNVLLKGTIVAALGFEPANFWLTVQSPIQRFLLDVCDCRDLLQQGEIVDDLVAVVPGIQCLLSGVVVYHGDVRVVVVEGDSDVLVALRLCVVDKVDLGYMQVRVSHIERAADEEGLSGSTFGYARIPRAYHGQCDRVQPTQHHVPTMSQSGVHNPQAALVSHEVYV